MTLPAGYDKYKDNSKDYDDKNGSSNNNNNPSELDMKKWRIDRIQTFLDSLIRDTGSARTQMKSQAELIENTLTTWRNAVLAATSFAASIIFGLSSVNLFREFILQMLAADIIIGLAAFIVFTIIKGKVHRIILSMDASFLVAISKLEHLTVYFNGIAYPLEKLEEDEITSYFTYGMFASFAAKVNLIKNYENMSNSAFFRKKIMRNDLRWKADSLKKGMEYAMGLYESDKLLWNKYGIISGNRYVHEDFFKYYGYKIEEGTGKIVKET
jgi:hypothetical protein